MARANGFPLSFPQMDAKRLVEVVNFSSSETHSGSDASTASSDTEAEYARRRAGKSKKGTGAGNKRKRRLTWEEKRWRSDEIDAGLKRDDEILAPLKERGRRRARPDDFDSSDEEVKKRAKLRGPEERSTTPERPIRAVEGSKGDSWYRQPLRNRALRPGETKEERTERLEREKGMSWQKLMREDALAHIKWNFGAKLGDEGLAAVQKILKDQRFFTLMYGMNDGLRSKEIWLHKRGIFEGQPVTKKDLKKIPSPPLRGENSVKDRVGGWLATVEIDA